LICTQQANINFLLSLNIELVTTMPRKIPEKWQSSVKAMKAVQVAFDMDEKIQMSIRKEALEVGLSPSDQIRDILGLPINKRPKRPRLTVSLAQSDYEILAKKYQLTSSDQLEIKKKLMDDLINHVNIHNKVKNNQ
jgi:hypothetical protein